MKNTVLIASGRQKVEAIRAALCTGTINTLIVDVTTARQVMDSF
ncbi:MAG: sugar-binding domain-containing protein [Clostridia bacterium]